MSRSGHPTIRVAVLCIMAFFAGRFLQLPGLPDAEGRGPTIHKGNRDRKILLEKSDGAGALASAQQQKEQQEAQQNPLVAGGPFNSFEELVDASGMLADYPPVPAGETGHNFYTVQPVQLLSWYPRAMLFPKFMDLKRCKEVIAIAEKQMAPSGLALKAGDTAESTRNVRTSQGTFLGREAGEVMAWIEDKIAVLTGLPSAHGEPFNVLHYESGQHYDSHFDSFDEASYGRQTSQRIATVLVYLTDVEEGGETSFLFEGKNGTDRVATVDYKKCDTGIKYGPPRAGDALLFWSVNPDHTLDKHALHGGCPVIKGTKWTATKWIRDVCHGAGCLGGAAISDAWCCSGTAVVVLQLQPRCTRDVENSSGGQVSLPLDWDTVVRILLAVPIEQYPWRPAH